MRNKTEKIIGFFAVGTIIMLLSFVSCTKKTTEKEVIVIPPSTVTTVKEAPTKTTDVTVDKNAAEVQTKKVEVIIKKPTVFS